MGDGGVVAARAMPVDRTYSLTPPPTAAGSSFDLEIDYSGEPLSIDQLAWRTAGDAPTFFWIVPEQEGPQQLAKEETPAELFRVRRRLISAEPDALRRRLMGYFYELDYETHPAVLSIATHVTQHEAERRTEIVEQLQRDLYERVRRRGTGFDPLGPVPADLPCCDLGHVRYVSDLLLGLFKRHFSTTSGALELDLIDLAFERFSCGEIVVRKGSRKYHGEPDSANYFLFAELAFVAIELGIDPWAWQLLLPTFVRTQQLYLDRYRPDTLGTLYFHQYLSSNRPAYVVQALLKDRLRREQAGMSSTQLALEVGRAAHHELGFF